MPRPWFLKSVVEITRHEFAVIFKTRRASTAAFLYFATALVGSFLYVFSLETLEEQLMGALIAQGADPLTAAGSVSLMGSEAYESTLAFLVGADVDQLAATFRQSPILPVCLWGSLAFLPALIIMTSFDQTVQDTQSRSICYSLLRTSRGAILVGKVLAHTLLFMVLTALCCGAILALATHSLASFEPLQAIPGFLRIWASLLPYGLCYLGITALASASVNQSFAAMALSMAILFLFQVFEWFGALPPDSDYAFLSPLQWLSPGHYVRGLWLADPIQPLLSGGAMLLLAGGLLLGAVKILEARDL